MRRDGHRHAQRRRGGASAHHRLKPREPLADRGGIVSHENPLSIGPAEGLRRTEEARKNVI